MTRKEIYEKIIRSISEARSFWPTEGASVRLLAIYWADTRNGLFLWLENGKDLSLHTQKNLYENVMNTGEIPVKGDTLEKQARNAARKIWWTIKLHPVRRMYLYWIGD